MTHINQRRDTAANWATLNPVLQLGEVGWETDTRKSKLGDGVTPWNDLQYTVSGGITKADVGLGNVDNTADADKPVSTAQQALIVDSLSGGDGDATHAPSRNAVVDALAAQTSYTDSKIASAVTDGDTTHAPSGDAVYDAIASATAGVAVPGAMIMYAAASAPSGWLICDGSFVSTTTYAGLFAVIGHTYNGGTDPADGTFKLPDLRGRTPFGRNAADTAFDTLGETGGSKTHAHGLDNSSTGARLRIAADNSVWALTKSLSSRAMNRAIEVVSNAATTASSSVGIALEGTSNSASSLPPYQTVNYLIKT